MIVQHISTFLSSTSRGGAPSSSAINEKKTLDSIEYLVCFMQQDELDDGDTKGDDNVIITKEDVATLLLPWSIAYIMRKLASTTSSSGIDGDDDDDVMGWRVLSCCLDILSSSSNKHHTNTSSQTQSQHETLLASSLPQGTLSRLLSYAAHFTLIDTTTNEEASDSIAQKHASNCYHHLTKRYHPTLDNASALLHEVDDKAMMSSGCSSPVIKQQQHKTIVINSTLQLIQRQMIKSNPKKMFGTICYILPCLGRILLLGGVDNDTDNDEDTTSGTKDLVQNIVWEGLFSVVHHMEGFRSMGELQFVPTLSKHKKDGNEGSANDIAASDDNEESPKPGKKRKKTKQDDTEVKKKKKISFQSSLFNTVSNLLSLSSTTVGSDLDSEGKNEEVKTKISAINDAIATANILPIIIQGFFERIRVHASSSRAGSGGGGSTTSEGDANVQFRFWCHVMLPVFEQLFHSIHSKSESSSSSSLPVPLLHSDELTLALLKTISTTLGFVLKYDAYLPSYNDPNEHHLRFLESITSGLLQCINSDMQQLLEEEEEEDERQNSESQFCVLLVTSLRNILLLNHRLLHEEMDNVIYFACSCLFSSVEKSHVNANELLCVLVKTYRELRQIGYFLTSIRGAFTKNNVVFDEKGNFESMMNLLRCGNIMESLSMSYQSCPSGQLHEIWNFFDGWIVNIVDEKFVTDEKEWANGTTTELAFAVQMFIIYIKNIRTNKQNSPELRSLCEKSMTTSMFKLLDAKKTCDGNSSFGRTTNCEGSNDILTRQGFDLCGWLVDLHTRSCFWIDNIDVEDGGPSSFLLTKSDDDEGMNVLSYLHNVMETSVVSDQFKKWRTSFLGSYWSSSSTSKSDLLEKLCDIDVPPSLRGSLQRLALHRVHQLHSMIYYCNLQESERHANDLQDDHSSSEALTNEARKLVNLSLYIACSQLSRQSSAQIATDESPESLWSSVAQSLSIWTHYCEPFHAELFMTWFFTSLCQNECPLGLPAQVFNLEKSITLTLARDASFYDVGQVMTVFMKVGIQFAFAKFLASVETNGSIENILESSEVTTSCLKLAEGDIKVTQEDHLDSASQVLTLLSSAPLELMLCNANLSLLDRVVGLDILSSQAIKQQSSAQQGKVVNIVRSTKSVIANLLPKTLLLSSDLDAPCLVNMTIQLFKSCRDFKSDNGVLLASCDAISEYFALCVDNFDKNSSMLVELFTQIGAPLVTSADTDFSSNSVLIRSVIRRMNIMNRHHSLSKKAYVICLKFVVNTQQRLQSIMIQHLSTEWTGQHRDVQAANTLLLESEILSFIGNHLETTPETNLVTTEQTDQFKKSVRHVFELISGVKRSHRSLEFTNASGYFFASLASAPYFFFKNCVSSSSILINILDLLAQCFASGQESPLLDAALCSLIRSSGLDQTKTIIEYVLSMSSKSENAAFITKIFNLMITCANNPEQHKFIAGKCKTFLLIAVGLLRDRSTAVGSNNVKLFSKTVTTLTSKKELLLLGGREISMICCEMNPLFYHGRSKDYDVDERTSIFHSSCVVVASLIAHYPKQLYGSPSTLFSLLLALLSDLLHTSAKKELSLKALEYAK